MRLVLSILALCMAYTSLAQQIAHASNVQLVSTPGTRLVLNGGIKFTGTTAWKDSGITQLLPNPAAGLADWVDSTAAGVLINNQGTTVFDNNSNLQQLIGLTTFHNLTIRNIGTNLRQSNEVRNILALDTGLIYFQNPLDSIYVSNTAIASVTSTSNHTKSWVHGKLSRQLNITGTDYLFPVGKIFGPDSMYAPIKLDKTNTVNAIYTTEYFPAVPFDYLNFLNPPLDHISEREYWHIYSNQPAGPDDDARLSLSWRGYSKVSANPVVRDSLLIAQYVFNPSGRWEATGGGFPAGVTGPDSLSGFVKHSNGSVNYIFAERRFTLGTFSRYNALPLKLLYWTATPDAGRVRLNWNVENEFDIKKYDIENSTDGFNFTHLLTTSSLQKSSWLYTEYDNNPATGWNYYRLKITDRQNAFVYAGVRKVRFEKGLQLVSIFPNPATEYLNVILPTSLATKVNIQLYSIDGKLINSVKPTGTNTSINVQKLAGGSYVLRLSENGSVLQSYQFVKQ